MNTFRVFLLPLVLLAFTACSTGDGGTEVDIAAAERSLLETDRAWSEAVAEGDVDTIVSYWSDDAVLHMPGTPSVRGKQEIRELVTEMMNIPRFSLSWQADTVRVSADGTMGYTSGINEATAPGKDGELVTTKGRYVTIWERTSDGSWKCVVDIANELPPENT